MSIRLISLNYTRENVSGSTDHLKGYLGSKVTATAQFGVSAYVKCTDDNQILVGDPSFVTSDHITTLDGFGFGDFRVGDTINMQLTYLLNLAPTNHPENGSYEVIDIIGDRTIRVQQVGGAPATLTEQTCSGGLIDVTSEPKGIGYSFGIIENDEATNFKSKIDGQELGYGLNDATAIPASLTAMDTIGKLNGYTGNAQVRKLGFADSEWTYEIVHVFYINPFYLISQLPLLQSGIAPSYLRLDKSLKHVFRVRTYREDTSSPFFQELTIDDRDGNVGYINENFNGLQPDFSLASISYGNTIGKAEKDVATTFDIDINEDSAVGKYIELQFILLPEVSEDYEELNTAQLDLYAFDRVTVEVGGAAVDGDRFGGVYQAFTGVSATVAASVITVSGTLDFGATTQSLIDDRTDKNYLIRAAVTSDAQTANDANTVLLEADFNNIGFVIPSALITHNTLFITHDQNQLQDGIGYTSAEVLVHEEVVMNNTISIDTSQIANAKLDSVKGSIIAKKNTGEVVELESKEFSLIGTKEISGVRFIDISESTGFNALDEEVRSKYRLFRDTDVDAPPVYKYRFGYPFMFRWEYYKQLILTTLEPDLFDATENFNGYNYNLARIGDITNWDIYFRLESVASVEGEFLTTTTDTVIVHHDYLENAEWTDEKIECFDEDGNMLETSEAPITPYFDSNGKTKIVASFFNDELDVLSEYYMIIVIGRFEQDGIKEVKTLSSVWDRSSISTLENATNSGRVFMEIVGEELKGTCFIDPSNLGSAKYTVFAWVKGRSLPVPGCTITATPSGSANNYTLMAIDMSGTAETTLGANDGTATASVLRGETPYSYLWDDPSAQTTATATGLAPNTYNVVVTDDNGCTITDFYEVLSGLINWSFLKTLSISNFRDMEVEDIGGGEIRIYYTRFTSNNWGVIDFDGTNFRHPVTDVIDTPLLTAFSARCMAIAFDSNYIVVSGDGGKIEIFDKAFNSLQSHSFGLVSGHDVKIFQGDKLVLSSVQDTDVRVIDIATFISTPASSVLYTLGTGSLQPNSCECKGNYIYIMYNPTNRFDVYEWDDIADTLTFVKSYTDNGGAIAYVSGNRLITSLANAAQDRSFIFDITDPSNPVKITETPALTGNSTAQPYISPGGQYYDTDKVNDPEDGFYVFNEDSPIATELQHYEGSELNEPTRIRSAGTFLVVGCNGNNTLNIYS